MWVLGTGAAMFGFLSAFVLIKFLNKKQYTLHRISMLNAIPEENAV